MARTNSRDQELRARAEAVIPGGMYGHQSTGLLPDDYPQFFERGEGAHIWDVDGRRYLDMMCAYGAYHGAPPWCVPRPTATLESDRANQILCDYNDVASLEAAVAEAGDDLACIFAAPFKHDAFIDQAEPDLAYARRARELCDRAG